MCPRRRARTRAGTRTRAECMPRGAAADPARVYILIMYLTIRGTPDKVFELIFIELLSRYGAVNGLGSSQGF